PHAIPAQVAGSIAVVESSRDIAGSFGFAHLLPDAIADADADAHDPARAGAWRAEGFAAAAESAVAGDAPLGLVAVLAIGDAAHATGPPSDEYARALAYADGVLARVAARVPAGASLLVLADHGHIMQGGHGDAEDDTRFVRACLSPSPANVTGARVHLID